MIQRFLKYLLYKSIFSKPLYKIFYFKWIRFYNNDSNLLVGQRLKDSLQLGDFWGTYQNEEEVCFSIPAFAEDKKKLPQQIAFYVDKTFTVAAGEYYHLEKAYLLGDNAVAVTTEGKIILDSAINTPRILPKCNPKLIINHHKFPSQDTLKDVISLVHIYANPNYVNYHHWVVDSLLLIQGKEAYEKKYRKKLKVLVNDNLNTYQHEFLDLLGVPVEDRV